MVGDRQEGREIAENVTPVPCERGAITAAIQKHVDNGRYAPSSLYGEGNAAKQIAGKLADVDLYVQKRLHFIHDEAAGEGAQ